MKALRVPPMPSRNEVKPARIGFLRSTVVEQSNFYDYQVPRMNEVPRMHIEVIQTDNHPTGAGQMSTPLVAPAISNAMAQLTGVRLRHTPFTPDRVKKALG